MTDLAVERAVGRLMGMVGQSEPLHCALVVMTF